MRISDQSSAIKLAICDDIGERSYDVTDVAAVLVQMLTKLPAVGMYHDMQPKWNTILANKKMTDSVSQRMDGFPCHSILFRTSMLKIFYCHFA